MTIRELEKGTRVTSWLLPEEERKWLSQKSLELLCMLGRSRLSPFYRQARGPIPHHLSASALVFRCSR